MDSFSITVTVLVGAICSVLGVLFTKGIDAYLKYSKDRREAESERRTAAIAEQHHQEDRVETQQERQIADLKETVKVLTTEMKSWQAEHLECVQNWATLKGQYEVLFKQYELQSKEIESLREWRHQVANTLHNEALKNMIGKITPPENQHT